MNDMTATVRVVLAGNPGVGKSSLLNSLLGTTVFPSGISIGSGLTQRVSVHSAGGVEYVDTPGLDDVEHIEQAAVEQSIALTTELPLKLIIVITLESGVVKSADIATVNALCTALAGGGADVVGRFTVLVNKCDRTEMDALGSEESRREVGRRIGGRWGVPEVVPLPIVPAAVGERNIRPFGGELWGIVERASVMKVPGVVKVVARDYQKVKNRLEEEVALLRRRVIEENRNKAEREKRERVASGFVFIVAVLSVSWVVSRVFLKE